MRRSWKRSRLTAMGVAAALAVPLIGLAAARPAAAAQPAPSGTALPHRVYAPYFESFLPGSIVPFARRSGARYFTIAFIQTPKKGSCTPTWNGKAKDTMSAGVYRSQVARLRRMGGDIIPSFGGYSADYGGTEIADSCTSVKRIAAAYASVIRTYRVTRLDMDVESNSLTNTAGINRRNKAIAMVERWAARHCRTLQIEYTLPVATTGLESTAISVLDNAVANRTRVDIVNIMTFDYYDGTTGTPHHPGMGAAAIGAAKRLHAQLSTIYPKRSSAQLWKMEGITMMPGIDDYPKKTEVTWVWQARRVMEFARAHEMSSLSIWAIQRDNGTCPGVGGSNTCSGIVQKPWAFSRALEPFTSHRR